ncbi:MAG: UDPGP type 1 family protein [Victivallaceae bacterium]|nr:UDPGP type 1 family protein [Victivallaceae bacterium]
MLHTISKDLGKHQQQHLLQFIDELDKPEQDKLLNQLNDINWDSLNKLIPEYVLQQPQTEIPRDLAPAPYFPAVPQDVEQQKLYEQAEAVGTQLISDGKVAALTVAGGQGSRLGFDGPKGTYPITPIKEKTLFQYFAESIARINEKYSISLTWYIMTSQLNDSQTKDFFAENSYFCLPQSSVKFFIQGTMPTIGYDGKLLMKDSSSLALAPDGHGGTLLALKRSGSLATMAAGGIEYISYFQVDNPLASIVNPLFLGLHHLKKSEMSAIMLAKTGPHEKLGNFCISGGRTTIIEYSDMPDELAEAVDANGRLRYIAGSPAIHVISRNFVEKLTANGHLELPWHRADKKIPCINSAGELINPVEPNGVKLESFIFDAMALAKKTMLLEAKREDEFAPIKNKTGVDSVESCRKMLIARDRRRLAQACIAIPANSAVEISPRLIVDDADAITYASNNNINSITTSLEGIYLK